MSTRQTEQREMRRTVADFLDKHSRLRDVVFTEPGYDPELWRRACAELGVSALLVPERCGGMGLDFADAAVVLAEFGRRLVPSPLLTTLVATAVLDACGTPEADELLARIADGTTVSFAAGPYVIHGADVDVLLFTTPDGLFAVDGADVTRRRDTALDHTRALATVTFDSPNATLITRDSPEESLNNLALVALAVESAAAAKTCLDFTVEYLKVRHQFGKPLGSFQALKHRCADLAVTVEGALATAWYAVEADPEELPLVAPLAKAVCADTLMAVAAESVQLHGGIGFTFEHDAHLYLKRGKANQLLFGSGPELRERVAKLAGL